MSGDRDPKPYVPPLPPGPNPLPPGESGSGCGQAFLFLVGLALLLPGVCTVVVAPGILGGNSATLEFWIIGTIVAAFGVFLIFKALTLDRRR